MTFSESELIESINNKNIEDFNKNGGINMYVYKISEEDDSNSEKNNILEKIKEINSKYSTEEYTPTETKTLELEEKEYSAPSDNEIEEMAINSLSTYKDSGVNTVNEKYSSKFSNVSEDAEKALEDKTENVSSIKSDYESSIKKATNNNIERGLSRSSIYNNALKAIEGEKETALSETDEKYNKAISKLENEKSILEQQKESALSSFDISYAVKLQSKIASLNSEIAKQQKEVLKYNTEVAKQETAYKLEQEKLAVEEQKKIAKRNSELQSLGTIEVAKLKAQEKYEVIYNYLLGLSKTEAMKELQQDSTYKNELGSYYALLYANMLKRKE